MSKDKFIKGLQVQTRRLSMFKEIGLKNTFLYNGDNGDSGGICVKWDESEGGWITRVRKNESRCVT